jgi:AcrR family transcriptional regulator
MADEKLDTQVRQEQIVEAALGLVATYGLKRLSMAAVARRVGLVPSGIDRHFRSKDAILAAVLDLLEKRLLANIEAARGESDDPLERLHGVLIRHIRFIRDGRAIPHIIFSGDLHSGHPERRARVQRILAQYLAGIRQLIVEGQQQGSIDGDWDAETAALLFLGMVVPAGIYWHLTEGGFDVTRHAARVWPMFRAALTRPNGAATSPCK